MTEKTSVEADMRMVTPKPLTPETFAPFGNVIDAERATEVLAINEGHTTRFHDLAELDLSREGGRPMVSIFRSVPLPLPIEIRLMERHPLGSQTFVPLSGQPYLVVVGRDTPENLPEDLEVFLAGPSQGVNYRAGTWHHYSLALEAPSDFLVIDRGGPGENLEEVMLPPHQRIQIAL